MRLQNDLGKLGFKVITVPEASTILVTNGGQYPGMAPEKRTLLLEYETILIDLQLRLESTFKALADHYRKQGHNVLVLFDRGILDVKAYAPADTWQCLLEHFATDEGSMCSWYDLVIHLTTAADGAAEHYTRSNNTARTETVEEAIAVDRRTFAAWEGHPRLHKVDNMPVPDAFEEKMRTVTNIILNHLGISVDASK